MMVDEFEFYRKVRAYYCRVEFDLLFTYRFAHRLNKTAAARGFFSCAVNAHLQTVEYTMQLDTDLIERPFSESGALLFSTSYEAIPAQRIQLRDYPIYKINYKTPIDYDWQRFIADGADAAINPGTIGAIFKKCRLKGSDGGEIDANLKVLRVTMKGRTENGG